MAGVTMMQSGTVYRIRLPEGWRVRLRMDNGKVFQCNRVFRTQEEARAYVEQWSAEMMMAHPEMIVERAQ